MNGTRHVQQASSSSIPESLTFSDIAGEDAVEEDHGGDYSTRFGELMSDDEEVQNDTGSVRGEDDEDEDEGFFYAGIDSQPSGTYREQLRDVLGPEGEDDEVDEQQVESSLIQTVQENEIYEAAMDDEARVRITTRSEAHALY